MTEHDTYCGNAECNGLCDKCREEPHHAKLKRLMGLIKGDARYPQWTENLRAKAKDSDNEEAENGGK